MEKYWCQPSRITASAPNAARLPTVMKKRPIQREMRRRLAGVSSARRRPLLAE